MIRRLRTWLGRHRDEERGAVLVLTCIAMIAVLGAGAMGVDLGFTAVGTRTAQAMADTASLDLANDISAANQYTTNAGIQTFLNNELAGVLKDNASDAQLAVTLGLWQGGKWTVPSGGCAGATPPCNSVAVTAKQTVPQPFWGGFNSLSGKSGSGIASCGTTGCTKCPTTACATGETMACLSIGSDLASFSSSQSTLLNSLLGSLGGSVNLTAVGYQGLADTSVSVGQLINASGTVLSPSNILTSSVSVQNWLSFLATAIGNQTAAGTCSSGPGTQQQNAETALNGISGSGTTKLELCNFLAINGSTCASGSIPFSSLSAGINVLQMLTTMAEISNGSSGVNLGLNLNLGLTTASVNVNAIQPPQIAYGPVGSVTDSTKPCPATTPATSTCATTAQIDLTLNLNVVGLSALTFTFLAAQGTATLDAVNCSGNAMTSTVINASTTTLSASANLLGLLGGLATVSVTGVPNTPLSYTVAPSTQHVGSTTPSLTVSGITVPGLGALLGPLFQALGVSVGEADVVDLGTNCNSVTLS
ncbi:MAG TPA: hypothetical protein VGG09_05975 [Acidimicrobiales bacterium]|jgi:uncharacterized membrane protein